MSAAPRQDFSKQDVRKGWCPGILRPMAAADGLIVRLRPTGGILSAATARTIADLAARFGNGKLDLTARANLQMRGVREASLPALVAALRALGLVDCDAAAEAVRNVVASPLAGLHDGPDIRPLVAALEARLIETKALHELPTKFGFLVDDGSLPSLADVAADVRFDWRDGAFAIGLGGTREEALRVGACRAEELVESAERIARASLVLFAKAPEATRMRALFDELDIAGEGAQLLLPLAGEGGPAKRGRMRGDAVSLPFQAQAVSPLIRPPPATPSRFAGGVPWLASPDFVGPPSPASGRREIALTLATPYGRLEAAMLHIAAALAAKGIGELRLTPWRSLLVPGHDPDDPAARAMAHAAGFIVDPGDARLHVAACVGAPECARATTATRADADSLAALAPARAIGLHVSGCAKGCAHAGAAPATLVAHDGLYDLVVDGHAGDPPTLRNLDLAAARAALTDLAAA